MTRTPDDTPIDLSSLAHERIPPPDLEDRTVEALRGEGLLDGAPAPITPVRPPPRPRRIQGFRVAAAAAAVAVFAAGFVSGQATGHRRTIEVVEALRDANAAQTAQLIQRSGSAYVEALAALGEASGVDRGVGREVARAVVRSALAELVRLDPDDPAVRRALNSLHPDRAEGEVDDGVASRTVLWF